MRKYFVLFMSVFMFSACCATSPVRQVDLHGENSGYFVSIKSYPRHHHPVVIQPVRSKHIAHTPPPPKPSKPHHHLHW